MQRSEVDRFNHEHDWESLLYLLGRYKAEDVVPNSISPLYDANSRLRGFVFELRGAGAVKI